MTRPVPVRRRNSPNQTTLLCQTGQSRYTLMTAPY